MKRLLGGKKRKGLLALLGLGATVAYARHRTGTSPSYWNTHNRPT
jgi:hypothetical protein